MKVLIADDHRLIIEGVKIKLAELDPGVEAVVAMNLDELDRAVAEHADELDLVLVDITMPGTNGHQHVARLRAQAQGWQPSETASPKPDSTHSIDGLRNLLTERQIDVMRLLSQGKPNKLIARDLGISEGTVKIHLAAIFRALNVRNRVEAVVASRKLQGL